MSKKESHSRLTAVSNLILDQHLARLQACAAERNASLQRLRDLAPKPAHQLDEIPLATTLLRYESWADARRSEINQTLARQTAAWLEARMRAETAFGRSEVLRKIQMKAKKNRYT